MSAAPPRGWPALSLIGLCAAAGSMAAGLSLHIRLLEPVAFAALALAGVSALSGAASSRRALAAALGENAELARRLANRSEVIESLGEAIIVIDERATVVSFNRAAERMFGYEAGDIIGCSLERLMTERARKAHAAYLAETGVTAMVEAARLRTVHKGVRKRGDIFDFELSMTEWSDEGRRMFTGVIFDVTDRERTADAARETEDRMAAVFEAVDDPLFVYALRGDGAFGVESMNRAAEDFTGRSRYTVAGWSPEQLAPEGGRLLKRALLECMSTGEPMACGFTLASHDEMRNAELRLSPLRGRGGEIRRVLVQARCGRHAPAPLPILSKRLQQAG